MELKDVSFSYDSSMGVSPMSSMQENMAGTAMLLC